MAEAPPRRDPPEVDRSGWGVPPEREPLRDAVTELAETIARLRGPDGCPWDREQTLESIKPHTLEECCELLEAIDSGNDDAIRDELGDVLLQVVLDAQIAADQKRFDLLDVVRGLTAKMIRRHPHVFGDAAAESAEDVRTHWQRVKEEEKATRPAAQESALDGVPVSLPSLARALKLTKKAAAVGYDFPHRAMLLDKLREEIGELREELDPDGTLPDIPAAVDMEPVPDEPVDDARRDRIEDELGDVLFVLANIARRWGVNPEEALRRSNRKFAGRFRAIESAVRAAGKTIRQASLEEMEAEYQAEKRREKERTKAGSAVSRREVAG